MKIPDGWGKWEAWRPWLVARGGELAAAAAFSTRLPLARAVPAEGAALAPASWALPLAGVLVGAVGAAVYALAHKSGVPPWPAAALAVAATVTLTGALHEDGLADTADGFGGGNTREQKLAIMRDSRIGTYGVCALVLSILLRAGVLQSLAVAGPVAAALIAAHAGARAALPALMFFVTPARSDGLSFGAGRPAFEQAAAAAVLGFLILVASLGFLRAVEAVVLLAIVVAVTARLSRQQIGGQTGDVLGALEQAGEIVILLVAAG